MLEDMSRQELGRVITNRSEELRRAFVAYEKGDPKGLILREEVLKKDPLRLRIPIGYLHGTQRIEGFTSSRARRVGTELEKYGVAFLEENPGIAVADFGENGTIIYLEDGHHRSIRSALFGIREIPTLVLPVDRFALAKTKAILRVAKTQKIRIDPEAVARYRDPQTTSATLEHQAADALDSYSKSGHIQHNQVVQGVRNIEELSAKFTHF